MNTQELTTTISVPKLSNLWWLIALIFFSILFFSFYEILEWGMFFCCLSAYISQLIGFVFIIDDSKQRQFQIKVTDYGKAIRRLRIYKVLFVVLSLLIILVDLAPFNIWVGSRWLINLFYWSSRSHSIDVQLDSEIPFRLDDMPYIYYDGHWIIYIMTLAIILCILSGCYVVCDDNALKREFSHFLATGKTKEQIEKEKKLVAKAAEEKELNNKIQKYGVSYREIKVCNESIIVSEEYSVICLAGTDYKFQDILNVQIHDNSRVIQSAISATAKTKMGSVVGRAIVGDVIAGPVGGIIGGATAKKQIDIGEQESRTEHNYSIYVTVNDLSRPVVRISIGRDENILNEIYSLLNIIINRNHR